MTLRRSPYLTFWRGAYSRAFLSSLRNFQLIRSPIPGLKAWAIFKSPSGTAEKLTWDHTWSAHLILVAFVTLSFGALSPQTVRATDFLSHTYPASTNAGELKIEATFHLWLPPHVKHLRAIIIHQHGC